MRLLVVFAAAILLGVALVAWCVRSQMLVVARGRAAIDEFHRSYDAGDDLAIYDGSHPILRQGLTADDALLRLSEVRARLGNVVSMSYSCHTHVSGPPPDTLRVEYLVTFEGGSAWETYDWALEGDATRLLAYAVETGFEDGEPDWEVALAPRGVRPNATTCADGEGAQVHWWEWIR